MWLLLPCFGHQAGSFDIIIMNMAIMDIATLEPLAAALPRLLKKNGGRWVFSILWCLYAAM
jgi:hypothetical protein